MRLPQRIQSEGCEIDCEGVGVKSTAKVATLDPYFAKQNELWLASV